MPKPFPEPMLNQSSDIISYANTVTKGWASILFVYSVAIVLFFIFKARFYKTSQALSAAFTLAAVIAGLMWIQGILLVESLMIMIACSIITTLYTLLENG